MFRLFESGESLTPRESDGCYIIMLFEHQNIDSLCGTLFISIFLLMNIFYSYTRNTYTPLFL